MFLFPLPLAQIAADVSNAKIANMPVSGRLAGKSFVPTRVELQSLGLSKVTVADKVVDQSRQYILLFRTGKEFFADAEIKVWLTFDDGTPIAPRTWHWKPTSFGTDAHRAQSYPKKSSQGSVGRGITSVHYNPPSEMVQEGYSANLQLVKQVGRFVDGRIHLRLPDGSFLNGTFRAMVIKQP